MLYMMDTLSEPITYNTNIANYQIKTSTWSQSKVDRFLTVLMQNLKIS